MPTINWWVDRRGNTFQETDRPVGWSLFWYCHQCGETYARAVVEEVPFKAVGGCCANCKGNRWSIPGSLESLSTIGWKVPEVIVRYQLARELAFLDSPQHPYNEKEVS